jgi:lambda family phage minor tail protein L
MIADLISLSPDSPIELFEISGWNLTNLAETLYICNFTGVTFEGVNYQAIGCESEGFDLIGQGPIPMPQLTVSNIGRVISDLLFNCKTNTNYRLEGSTVLRRITQKQFLDGQPNAGFAIKELPQQQYIIEQMQEETYLAVKFRLASPFDVEGVTLPARPLLRSCSWRYRSAECGWTGGMFTLNNQPTTNPALDQCAKSLPACECRFGPYAELNFGGAPGLNTYR